MMKQWNICNRFDRKQYETFLSWNVFNYAPKKNHFQQHTELFFFVLFYYPYSYSNIYWMQYNRIYPEFICKWFDIFVLSTNRKCINPSYFHSLIGFNTLYNISLVQMILNIMLIRYQTAASIFLLLWWQSNRKLHIL